MNLYPVNLALDKVPCLVVGGGGVALRKVTSLAACNAAITVVSPEICPGLERWARQKRIHCVRQRYRRRHVAGKLLVIAATSDPAVNERVSRDAQENGALVNVVDAPALCSVIIPSVIRVNPLVITVATQGRFPGLAKKMRRELTPQLRDYAAQARRLARLRDAIKKRVIVPGQRQRLIRMLLSPPITAQVATGRIRTLKDLIAAGRRKTRR